MKRQRSIWALLVGVACLNPACRDGMMAAEGAEPTASAQQVDAGNPSGQTAEPSTNQAKEEQTMKTAADDPALTQLDTFIASKNIDAAAQGWKTRLPKPPQATFDSESSYFWNLQTTEGAIKIRLMPDVAPMHVSSTIYLTRLGFYDGITFHRVISRFMAQGGCPQGNGTGGPGYKYAGEFDSKVRHNKAGLLSMANAGPNTDGSQFFLTFVPTPHLDGKHTIFGEIVDGMDTMKALEAAGTGRGQPKKRLLIEKATISIE